MTEGRLEFSRWLRRYLAIGGCLLALPLAAAPPESLSDVVVPLPSGGQIHKRLRTFKDLKDERAVRQKYDFSCGAAALTTVLRHYYKINVTEESVVSFIIHKHGKEEAIRRYKEKKGFSLLDLKTAAASVGFKAIAYSEMTLADLVEMNAPAIVPIRTRTYDHFIVFRGVREDRVYLTDPIMGNATMKAGNFVDAWRNGVGLILKSKKGLVPVDWQPEATALGYVSQAMTRSLLQAEGLGFVPRGKGEF